MQLPKIATSILIGVLAAVVVGAFLGDRFAGAAVNDQLNGVAERQATIHLMALTDLVTSATAAPTDDAENTEDTAEEPSQNSLADLIRSYDDRREDVADIQIISGRRLLASTLPGDLEEGQDGRRLKRDEKPIFDLTNELHAGIATNSDEGVFRKNEIDLAVQENGDIIATAPLMIDGRKSTVRMRVTPSNVEVSGVGGFLWIFLLPLALVFAYLAFIQKNESRRNAAIVASLLFAVSFGLYTGSRMESYRSARVNLEEQIAEHYTDVKATAIAISNEQGFQGVGPDENTWDSDIYRRPLGYISLDGQLVHPNIDASLSDKLKSLRNALIFTGLLSLAILLAFATGTAGRTGKAIVEHRNAYAYITPAMLGMLLLVFFPFFYGIALSFTGQTLYNTDQSLLDIWVGLENYVEILTDWKIFQSGENGMVFNYDNFYWTLFITIMWTACNLVISVSLGLGLALALNTKTLKGKPIYRAILILPWAIPNYVTALIWKGLFHKQFGPINQIIEMFGGQGIAWFDSVFTSFATGIIVNSWLGFPFMMVICLGGLQSISQDMYEAAKLDGAGHVQQFRYITLPSLKPTLIPAIIISVVWTFNMFNIIYLVSGGEPGGSNEILVTQAYKIAFEKYQYGYAAAYSTVIFLILLVYGVFQNKVSKATEDISK